MTAALAMLLAALAVLPADRLAMADRLFNKGSYADAEGEYRALEGAEGIAPDDIMFRLAECARALGRKDDARRLYSNLVLKHPASRHANRSRFMYAMGAAEKDRRELLMALDTDRIDPETRAAALYHLGVDLGSADLLLKCARIQPKGRYVPYAKLRAGSILTGSALPSERRRGLELLLGIAFGHDALAEEALYLAALQSYREKNYSESGSLFRRYRKNHPKGKHLEECATMSAWSDFLLGRYADAAAACGEAKTDDLAYIRAASAYATGDNAKALRLFKRYLEDFPQGKYRADAELPVARIEFDAAEKQGDATKTVESAKRGFALSKRAADQLRLAWAYEKTNHPEEARAEYARLAKEHPGTEEAAEALYRRAMIDARAQSWSSVELTLAEALATKKILKFKASALYWRGIAAVRLGHEAEGLGFLKDALALGLGLDEAREARLLLADADFRAGRTDAAKEAYAKLVAEGATARMNAQRILAVGKLLGGDAAKACAEALVKGESAEWRQAGWTLLGATEEKAEHFTAAIEAYRKAVAEDVKTEELAAAALHLGKLESASEDYDRADRSLKLAVSLNAASSEARADAYLALARNAEAKGDATTACAYATVVTSLFEGRPEAAEAAKILKKHPEEAK